MSLHGNVSLQNVTADQFQLTDGTVLTTPVGVMFIWPTAVAPGGYLLCQGQSLSIITYSALFAVIGTTYGSGPGTFNLPDLRQKIPIGLSGAGLTASLNNTGGTLSTTLTTTHLPAHTHTGTTGTESADHSHSGTTGLQSQNHDHTVPLGNNDNSGGGPGGFPTFVAINANADSTWTENRSVNTLGVNTDHTHSFSTGGRSAAHTHSFTTASAGSGGSFVAVPYLTLNYIIKYT